jgi:hypothetical protein
MRIYGKPGKWYVEDEEQGFTQGPFATREEAKQAAQVPSEELGTAPLDEGVSSPKDEQVVMRLIVERGDTGRITEIKVVPG